MSNNRIVQSKHIVGFLTKAAILVVVSVAVVNGMVTMIAVAQDQSKQTTSANSASVKKQFSKAIADNSFFIEEAYNQEAGVVQHISNATTFWTPNPEVAFTFTQEWPIFSPKHQFSYMIPYSFLDSNTRGVGDVMINYRYQLTNEEDHWASLSPRASLILPSGNEVEGLGTGSAGVQLYLPGSKRVSEQFTIHFNAGMTLLPNVPKEVAQSTVRKNLSMYHLGGSVIWLKKSYFNMMFEYLTTFANDLDDAGKSFRYQDHIVSPGVRFAIDIGALQIVPGIAVPFHWSQGKRDTGLFLYLSFEHPFTRGKK
jgi:hypothetical protein